MSGRSEERGGAGTSGHFFRRTGSSQGCHHLSSVQSLRAGDGLRPHIPTSPHPHMPEMLEVPLPGRFGKGCDIYQPKVANLGVSIGARPRTPALLRPSQTL